MATTNTSITDKQINRIASLESFFGNEVDRATLKDMSRKEASDRITTLNAERLQLTPPAESHFRQYQAALGLTRRVNGGEKLPRKDVWKSLCDEGCVTADQLINRTQQMLQEADRSMQHDRRNQVVITDSQEEALKRAAKLFPEKFSELNLPLETRDDNGPITRPEASRRLNELNNSGLTNRFVNFRWAAIEKGKDKAQAQETPNRGQEFGQEDFDDLDSADGIPF